MSSELPHNWQNDLMKGIEDVEHKMEDARERLSKNPTVKADYEKALGSVRTAKNDISHFIGTFNAEDVGVG